ncbi:CMRF35-like molecule 9 [Engraulis encrasicolus]|uniref:CMRF35-like molecule 9 n=1 Tax=Engraulis encrasicolus TaxID=184585 RepID=UPI002FD14E90
MTVSGKEGSTVSIDCPPGDGAANYPKYFCKGMIKNCVNVIGSDGTANSTGKGKVSLLDKKDKNRFTVIIHNLTRKDGGTYWCGVDTWGPDYVTQVYLKVVHIKSPDPYKDTALPTTITNTSMSDLKKPSVPNKKSDTVAGATTVTYTNTPATTSLPRKPTDIPYFTPWVTTDVQTPSSGHLMVYLCVFLVAVGLVAVLLLSCGLFILVKKKQRD